MDSHFRHVVVVITVAVDCCHRKWPDVGSWYYPAYIWTHEHRTLSRTGVVRVPPVNVCSAREHVSPSLTGYCEGQAMEPSDVVRPLEARLFYFYFPYTLSRPEQRLTITQCIDHLPHGCVACTFPASGRLEKSCKHLKLKTSIGIVLNHTQVLG